MRAKAWVMLCLALSTTGRGETLYQEGHDPYGATRSFHVGDQIEVVIQENLSASRESQMSVQKQAHVSGGLAGLAGMPNLSSDLSHSGQGSGSSHRNDQMLGTLSARVEKIRDDGALELSGERSLDLDGELQHLTLKALARPEDVGWDNSISSQRLANTDLKLENRGTAARGGRLGWLHWILSWVGL